MSRCNFEVTVTGRDGDILLLAGLIQEDAKPNDNNSGGWSWDMSATIGDPQVNDWCWIRSLEVRRVVSVRHPDQCLELALAGETTSGPPMCAMAKLAGVFPALTFTVSYSIDSVWDCARWQFDSQGMRLLKQQAGWFDTDDNAPIHHWWVCVECNDPSRQQDVIDYLEKEGVIIHPEYGVTLTDAFVTRTTPEAIKALIDEKFPGILGEIDCHAFTLDEDIFMESRAMGDLRIAAQVERDLKLTAQELTWLARRVAWEGGWRECGTPTARYDENGRKWCTGEHINLVATPERVDALGSGQAGPNPKELNYLLKIHGNQNPKDADRIDGINNALANPRWRHDHTWLPWDKAYQAEQAERARMEREAAEKQQLEGTKLRAAQ
jgi:hypothetical protein